jgi:hypothetical protein
LVFLSGVIGRIRNGEGGILTLTRGKEKVRAIVELSAGFPAPEPSKGPYVSLCGERRREKIVNGQCLARGTSRASKGNLLFAGGVIGGIGNRESGGGLGERGGGRVGGIRQRGQPNGID